jgi:S-adenosyl-L-methionine hydrolase (adenosine-forming)
VPLASAGDRIDVASLAALPKPVSRVTGSTAEAEVVTVDRFGNAQLSVTGPDAARAGITPGTAVTLGWHGRELTVPFARTFGDVAAGELVSYTDSAGFVSVAVNGGHAARRLALYAGTRVTLRVTELFHRVHFRTGSRVTP